MGRRDLARQAFAHADASNENYAPYRGMLYAAEGKADSAFLFDRVERWGLQSMLNLRADPHLHPVRDDPRYRDLLTRLGILTGEPVSTPRPAR